MPSGKNTHVCVECPFRAGDDIEAKEVVHRAFGPTRERWILMRVEQVLPNNKMVLTSSNPSYPATVAVPYRAGWFRKKEWGSGDPHQK